MSCWTVLNIEETDDLSRIKKAYARLLPLHHPEKDREGYQNLRMAFNEALKIAKAQKKAPRPETIDMSLVESPFSQKTKGEQQEEASPQGSAFSPPDTAKHQLNREDFDEDGLQGFLDTIDAAMADEGVHPDWSALFADLPAKLLILPDSDLAILSKDLTERPELSTDFWHAFFSAFPAVDLRSDQLSKFKELYPDVVQELEACYSFTSSPLHKVMQVGLPPQQLRTVLCHQRNIHFSIERQQFETALEHVDTLLERGEQIPMYYKLKLNLLIKVKRRQHALSFALEMPDALLEDDWELAKIKADLLADAGQYERALELYRLLYEAHMEEDELYLSVIRCSSKLGRHLFYNLELAQNFAEQHPAHLGISLLIRDCEEQIIKAFIHAEDRLAYIQSTEEDDLPRLMIILLKHSLLEEARLIMRNMPDRPEKLALSYQTAGLAAIAAGDTDAALRAIDQAFWESRSLKTLFPPFMRFFEFLEHRELYKKIAEYISPFVAYPLEADFLIYFLKYLGKTAAKHYMLTNWPKLSALFGQFHRFYPHNVDLYLSEAECLTVMERFEDAIETYKFLIDSPLHVSRDTMRGIVARLYDTELENPDAAANYYQQIADPMFAEMHRAYALHNQEKFGEALEIYLKYVDEYHDKFWIYRDIGYCAHSTDRHELAIEYLRKALDLDHRKTNALDIQEVLANSYNKLGQHQTAFAILKSIETHINSMQALAQLGMYYRILEENFEKAAQNYRSIFTAEDFNPDKNDSKFVGIQLLAYSDMLDDMQAPWHRIVDTGREGFKFLEKYSRKEDAEFNEKTLSNMVKTAVYLEDPENARFLFPLLSGYTGAEINALVMELKEEFPQLYRSLYVGN